MSNSKEHEKDKSSYVIDAENVAEMARLVQQDRLLTSAMSQLLPPPLQLKRGAHVLDIACGPGGWVNDVAYMYPHAHVLGVDISSVMIEYARATARSNGLQNASFDLMDVRGGLIFADESFDFVNARFLASFMRPTAWQAFVQECKRVIKPGGFIRLTEAESPITNSAAFERLNLFSLRALKEAGQSFSADGNTCAITPVLSSLLRATGFVQVERDAHVVDFAAGTEENATMTQNLVAALKLMQPFIIRWKQATQEEVDSLYSQAVADLYSDTFRGVWFYLSAWGQKPALSDDIDG